MEGVTGFIFWWAMVGALAGSVIMLVLSLITDGFVATESMSTAHLIANVFIFVLILRVERQRQRLDQLSSRA